MADNMEKELAEGVEQDIGLKAMAEKFAPRGATYSEPRVQPSIAAHLTPPAVSIEMKLQQIEKLIGEIRQMSAHVKGLLG